MQWQPQITKNVISEITGAPTISLEPPWKPFDLLVRVSTNTASESPQIAWGETASIVGRIQTWVQTKSREFDLLLGVVKWQHRLIDYNAQYNAFLLDQITEEDFEKVSQGYSYSPKDIPPVHLASAIATILELTSIDYTPSDFADLFQCTPEAIQAAIDHINLSSLQFDVSTTPLE